jgi:hypothetical protein
VPWTCGACGVEAERDETECPSCAAPKTSWTMVRQQTRTFVLAVKRFEVLRGADKAPATVAPVMAKAAARGASPLRRPSTQSTPGPSWSARPKGGPGLAARLRPGLVQAIDAR